MNERVHAVIDSPVGPLTLVATGGALCGIYMHEQRHRPAAEAFGPPDITGFNDVIDQLHGYFDGSRTRFEVPMAFVGTEFQQRVWTALCDIPYGHTVSYGQLAEAIGNPAASRAVGLANGRNPISIIVPCHRVVGSTGDLTGYGGGIERKRFLLDFERSRCLSTGSGQRVPNSRMGSGRLTASSGSGVLRLTLDISPPGPPIPP